MLMCTCAIHTHIYISRNVFHQHSARWIHIRIMDIIHTLAQAWSSKTRVVCKCRSTRTMENFTYTGKHTHARTHARTHSHICQLRSMQTHYTTSSSLGANCLFFSNTKTHIVAGNTEFYACGFLKNICMFTRVCVVIVLHRSHWLPHFWFSCYTCILLAKMSYCYMRLYGTAYLHASMTM